MVKRPTVHQLRCETLNWVFQHTRLARNGLRARRLAQLGASGTLADESKDMLGNVFEQCDFMLDKDVDGNLTQGDDEIAELWDYTLDHWDYTDHCSLVERLLEIGMCEGFQDELGNDGAEHLVGCPLFTAIELRLAAEAKQDDVDALAGELVDAEALETEGAW